MDFKEVISNAAGHHGVDDEQVPKRIFPFTLLTSGETLFFLDQLNGEPKAFLATNRKVRGKTFHKPRNDYI